MWLTFVGNQSQATIQRILRRIADDQGLLEVKPAEIIDQRTAGIITTEQMMDKLLNWKYTFGRVVHIGDEATGANISGDWDTIEMAFYRAIGTSSATDEFQKPADRQRDSDSPRFSSGVADQITKPSCMVLCCNVI